MSALTPTMIAALEYAREHGNKLIRHQGGFWADANWSRHQESHGTTTVEAIVKRGYATYTYFIQSHGRVFPVEATLAKSYTDLLKA